MKLRKYHGLGNDYLISIVPDTTFTSEDLQLICTPHYGAGSDGILTGPYFPGSPDFETIASYAQVSPQQKQQALCALRIWNPDGSEAEKSGNGLRIFSRFLYDTGRVQLGVPFHLLTLGGFVTSTVFDPDDKICVDMGTVHFSSPDFPGNGTPQTITLDHTSLTFLPASIGNPHCIVLNTPADKPTTLRFGPLLETASIFPNRINVQFLKVQDDHNIAIQIWERGAAYTLASGSSASAAAAVAVKLGYCTSPVTVHMPGGDLQVQISPTWELTQTGPTRIIYDLDWLAPLPSCHCNASLTDIGLSIKHKT